MNLQTYWERENGRFSSLTFPPYNPRVEINLLQTKLYTPLTSPRLITKFNAEGKLTLISKLNPAIKFHP